MDKKYTVYMHKNKINGKVYIGATSLKPEIRYGRDGKNYKVTPRFWEAIQEYGWASFDHIILKAGLNKEDAYKYETDMIKEYKSQNPEFGYNVQRGGLSQPGKDNPFFGHTHSEKTRDIISEANRKRVWKDESKKKITEKLSGSKSPCAKKIICKETNKVYGSLTEAAQDIKGRVNKISSALRSESHMYHGMHWYYFS